MRSILSVFFILVCVHAISQTSYDDRLLVRYSADQLQSLAEQNPDLVGYLDFYLNYGFSILHKSEIKNEKAAGTITLKSLKPKRINIFEENLPLPLKEDVYYNIVGSDEVLVLYGREKTLAHYYKTQKINQLKK